MMCSDSAPNNAVPGAPAPDSPRRLLILGCTRTKTADPGLVAALHRYDGPAFRVLRRYLRQNPTDPPLVYVLSAEFGLIAADHPIPNYDRLMTKLRARELEVDVSAGVRQILLSQDIGVDPARLLVILSRNY